MIVDRRRFLLSVAGAAVAWPTPVRAEPLRLGLVSGTGRDPDASSTALGARLGAEEAARAAALFGRGVELTVDADPRRLVTDARAHVLLGGAEGDDAACERLAALAEEAGALFLNVGCAADALRGDGCRPGTFHVAASDAMRRAARAAAGEGSAGGEVALWHASLERFGAAQLNDRFRARFRREMDGDAWAAWMAVKVASEAALRVRDPAPAALAAYLVRPGVRFDGHKGRPLTFGAPDHQLRQPLYLVRRGAGGVASVAELPAQPDAARAGGCTTEEGAA